MPFNKTSLLPHFKKCNKAITLLVAGCLLWTLTGCSTTGGNAFSKVWTQAKSPFQGKAIASNKDSKGPGKLELSYAKWQEELGNLTEASQSYEKVLSANPKSADAVVGLARIDQLAGRTARAQKGYRKALQLNPNNAQALDAMGQFYASQQRWDEAVSVISRAMFADPKEPLYQFHLAVAKTKQGDIQGAMPHFTRTVGEAQGHYNIGRILMSEGKNVAAGRQFQRALQIKPDFAVAQQMMSEIQAQNPNAILPAGATQSQGRFQGHSVSPANLEQQSNQRSFPINNRSTNQFQGYQQSDQFSAPEVSSNYQRPIIQPANHSGKHAGHSTFPSSFQQANQRMVTPASYPHGNTANGSNNNGLTPAQREQLQNQFHSKR